MELSPDAGLRLADAFCRETKLRSNVENAVISGAGVPISTLAKWGESAYLSGPHGAQEAAGHTPHREARLSWTSIMCDVAIDCRRKGRPDMRKFPLRIGHHDRTETVRNTNVAARHAPEFGQVRKPW